MLRTRTHTQTQTRTFLPSSFLALQLVIVFPSVLVRSHITCVLHQVLATLTTFAFATLIEAFLVWPGVAGRVSEPVHSSCFGHFLIKTQKNRMKIRTAESQDNLTIFCVWTGTVFGRNQDDIYMKSIQVKNFHECNWKDSWTEEEEDDKDEEGSENLHLYFSRTDVSGSTSSYSRTLTTTDNSVVWCKQVRCVLLDRCWCHVDDLLFTASGFRSGWWWFLHRACLISCIM